jgi:hypothetical protein
MAKRRVSRARKTSSHSSRGTSALNFRFDSLTFLLFAVFVLIVAMVMVSRMMGLSFY